MIFAIATLLTKFGLDFSVATKWARRVLLAGTALVIILIAFTIYRCSRGRAPKLNEQEIQKGEQAVKEKNDEELRKILTNSDIRQQEIDSNVAKGRAESVNAQARAKEVYSNMNTQQLAEELERRK